MTPLLFISCYVVYYLAVYATKRYLDPRDREAIQGPSAPWHPGHEHAMILSPDYWCAFRFKCAITDTSFGEQRAELLKRYVVTNNRVNVMFSVYLAMLCLVASSFGKASPVFQVLALVAFIRLVSRGYEIAYAFGRDVLQKTPSTTGLNKTERIRLALLSYFEIYFFSAAAYTALPTVANAAEAVALSLNVGTLTNVGYAFSKDCAPFVVNIVFVQVITTLSLVVLSLAAYLSRGEDARPNPSLHRTRLRRAGERKR